jgi:GWxTD domain-containing protein
MWKTATLLALSVLTGAWAIAAGPELSKEQQRFLDEEAVYIITQSERESFLALPTSSERDDFIERFWRVRDPVPETAVNEFKDEHFKRIREANEKFKGARPGWMSEQGRTYITLGPPQDVQSYPNSEDLFPLEIWFYYNLDIPRFPSALQLVFFKRNGVGEYRLFSPAFDGMKSLIADPVQRGMLGPLGQIPFSARQMWDVDIIKAAEGVAPGENLLSSEVVLSDMRTPGFVFEKTRRNLSARVTSEASFGGELPVDFSVDFFRGEDEFSAAHLALEISAADVRVNQYDDRMLGRYDLLGTITRVDSGEAVEEFRDSLEIEIPQKDWDAARHFPVLFQQKVGLLPGRYRFELYVRDFVGRRLGIVNRTLVVPAFVPDKVSISSFLAAFKADDRSSDDAKPLPNQFGPIVLYPKPNHLFGDGQRVLAFLQVYYPRGESASTRDPEVSVRFTLKRGEETVLDETNRFRRSAERPDAVDVLKQIGGPVLTPGDYQLEAVVTDTGSAFSDMARLDFTVGAHQEMGRLSTMGLPPELRPAEALYRKAEQYLAAERYPDAIRLLKVALDYEPYYQSARISKARAEIYDGRPEDGASTALEALGREPKNVDALSVLGLARFRQGKLDEAVDSYHKAIEIGGEEPAILNALAETEFRRGNKDAAVTALTRSLELAPDQPRAREFLEEVKRSP